MKSILAELELSPQLDTGNIDYIIDNGLFKLAATLTTHSAFFFKLAPDSQYRCTKQYSSTSNQPLRAIDSTQLTPLLTNLAQQLSQEPEINSPLTIDDTTHSLCQLLSTHNIYIAHVLLHGKNKGFICLAGLANHHLISDDIALTLQGLAQLTSRGLLAQQLLASQNELEASTELLEEVEQIAVIGGWEFNLTTQQLLWTKETYKIYGLAYDSEITPEIGINSYSPEAQAIINNAFHNAVEHLTPYELELPFIDLNGNKKWVRTTGKPRVRNGLATHIYGAFEDITKQKQLLNNEQEIKANLKLILDNLNDAIVTISSKGIILSCSKAVEHIFGHQSDALIGKDIGILMPEPYASKHSQYMEHYLTTGQAGIIGIGRELPAIKKDGSEFPMELSISEALQNNEKVFIGIVRDITLKKKNEQDIKKLAFYDRTTGVLNSHSFENDLASSFQKRTISNDTLTALLVDIDKFSQINLIYGDKVGDLLLSNFAARLAANIPNRAALYRNNADSFFILLDCEAPSADHEITKVKSLADNLVNAIAKPFEIRNKELSITASIGVISILPKEIAIADIRSLLEAAVVTAKKQGGACVAVAQQHEIKQLVRHSELEIAMKKPEFIDELGLLVQPQYDVFGEISGSEALVRWYCADYGLVSPAEFIPLAEANGKIVRIGEWVINKACEMLVKRKAISELSYPLSVNISAKQIAQPNFCEFLLGTLARHQVSTNEMILELTETTLISDYELIIERMVYLKEQGISFSLDDFGTGYSCLSYIQQLPISELKIDKSFVDRITNEHDEVAIVDTIIQMAKTLKLNIVAEGVESPHQLAYLKAHGCETIQGYLFSKPLDETRWLALHNNT